MACCYYGVTLKFHSFIHKCHSLEVRHVVREPLAGCIHVRTKLIACPGSRLRLIPFHSGLEAMFAKSHDAK